MKYLIVYLLSMCMLAACAWDFRVTAQGGGNTWISPRCPVDQNSGTELTIVWKYQFHGSMKCPDRIIWLDDTGKQINADDISPQPEFYPAGEALLEKTLEYHQFVPRSQIPPNAKEFQLKLIGSAVNAAGSDAYVDFFAPEISWSPVVTARNPYNWFELSGGVEFSSSLAAGEQLRGIVKNSDGEQIADVVSDTGDWRWMPELPGFYSVKFSKIAPDGKPTVMTRSILSALTQTESGVPVLIQQVRIPRDIQCFAVADKAPNPACGDPDSPFGSNATAYPGALKRQLDVIRLMNISNAIRYHWFRWNEIEKEPGRYDWSQVDRVLAIGEENGFAQECVLVNTFGTPKWNSPKENPDSGPWTQGYQFYAPKDLKAWGDFLTAFAARYPRLRTWELWNEPHLDGFSIFWQKSTPKRYVELLQTGYEALKKENPHNIVVSGGIGMRYLPWYAEFLKEGGNRWCDMVGTHCGYDHTPFRELEKANNAPSHLFYETEWHTNLFECRMENYPTEEELSYWMLVNLANLLTQGSERIMAFYPISETPRDLAPYKAKLSNIQQICGLFQPMPNVEPRHQAYALRVAVDQFQGKVKSLGAWTFMQSSQTAAAFESKKGKVLFFWAHEGNEKQPQFAESIRQALKGKRILDWEGRPVSWENLRYARVYYGIDPDIAALQKGGTAVSYIPTPRRQGKAQPLDHIYRGVYSSLANPVWHQMEHFEPIWGRVSSAPNFKSRFAVGITPKALELIVEVTDDHHCPVLANPGKNNFWDYDSIQFAIDTKSQGNLDDVLEFEAGANGRLVKLAGPGIDGDLSDEYTPPNTDVRRGSAKITRDGNVTTYRIMLPATDLYPFQPQTGMPLRFSILVNDNNGAGREGYLEWGSGIGGIKSAAKYGDLCAPTENRVVATQGNLSRRFQEAEITKGETLRVSAAPDATQAAGVKCEDVPVVPGGCYMISGEVRGSAGQLFVMCFGPGLKRFDLPTATVGADWSKFGGEIIIPEGATQLSVALFYWKSPGKEFEIRNFQIKGL